MKRTYIIGILIIAVAIAIIISMTGNASTYVSFQEAKKLAEKGVDGEFHVVGELPKSVDGTVLSLVESPDKLSFSFELIDENKFKQLVLSPNPMPTDFTKSEKVVIVGSFKSDLFVASKILLKCPSKYKQEQTLADDI